MSPPKGSPGSRKCGICKDPVASAQVCQPVGCRSEQPRCNVNPSNSLMAFYCLRYVKGAPKLCPLRRPPKDEGNCCQRRQPPACVKPKKPHMRVKVCQTADMKLEDKTTQYPDDNHQIKEIEVMEYEVTRPTGEKEVTVKRRESVTKFVNTGAENTEVKTTESLTKFDQRGKKLQEDLVTIYKEPPKSNNLRENPKTAGTRESLTTFYEDDADGKQVKKTSSLTKFTDSGKEVRKRNRSETITTLKVSAESKVSKASNNRKSAASERSAILREVANSSHRSGSGKMDSSSSGSQTTKTTRTRKSSDKSYGRHTPSKLETPDSSDVEIEQTVLALVMSTHSKLKAEDAEESREGSKNSSPNIESNIADSKRSSADQRDKAVTGNSPPNIESNIGMEANRNSPQSLANNSKGTLNSRVKKRVSGVSSPVTASCRSSRKNLTTDRKRSSSNYSATDRDSTEAADDLTLEIELAANGSKRVSRNLTDKIESINADSNRTSDNLSIKIEAKYSTATIQGTDQSANDRGQTRASEDTRAKMEESEAYNDRSNKKAPEIEDSRAESNMPGASKWQPRNQTEISAAKPGAESDRLLREERFEKEQVQNLWSYDSDEDQNNKDTVDTAGTKIRTRHHKETEELIKDDEGNIKSVYNVDSESESETEIVAPPEPEPEPETEPESEPECPKYPCCDYNIVGQQGNSCCRGSPCPSPCGYRCPCYYPVRRICGCNACMNCPARTNCNGPCCRRNCCHPRNR